ncbi:dUTP diphosphatase [Polycladidibacter stylochi]|uniref:dUTP diphosphatase n=1 Tax=Polycladidibacter stylochi TaxID=1807766 RepID=UPI00082F213A|nr:dUTP diphosphatase [Pseudovibrio stylochi]
MSEPTLKIIQLDHAQGLDLPAYESSQAAGMDLRAALRTPITIAPNGRALVATGLKLAIPEGFEGQVRPRSGLAIKHGITVLNSPGTIDSDYRGEVSVILVNFGSEPFVIEHGMRIAQLVIAPVQQVKLSLVSSLSDTQRGEGGFGSSGLK